MRRLAAHALSNQSMHKIHNLVSVPSSNFFRSVKCLLLVIFVSNLRKVIHVLFLVG